VGPKVAAACELVRDPLGLAMRAAVYGGGSGLTFEGYVTDAVKSGELARSLLGIRCAPFPGRLYYPSRRQHRTRADGGVVSFVADWRQRERRTLSNMNVTHSRQHAIGGV